MSTLTGDRSSRSVAVVVVAAGRGERFAGAVPKALEQIHGRALLVHALEQIAKVDEAGTQRLTQVVVVGPPAHLSEVREICDRWPGLAIEVVAGGRERLDSVSAALNMLRPDIEIVLVHDAARAFTPPVVFERVIEAVTNGADGVVPVLAVVDTIKEVDADGRVRRTVPRDSLRAVQTPQGFARAVLVHAHSDFALAVHRATQAGEPAPPSTDDAGMVEAAGYGVVVVAGDPDAFKVTTPFDRLIADSLVANREAADV